jgi:hypothetical protein
VTQELGILALIKRGMCVLTANGDDLTDSSDPSRKMMRQIAGSEDWRDLVGASLSLFEMKEPTCSVTPYMI